MSPYFLTSHPKQKIHTKKNQLVNILSLVLSISNLVYQLFSQGMKLSFGNIVTSLLIFLILRFYQYWWDQLLTAIEIFRWLLPMIGAIFIIPGVIWIYQSVIHQQDYFPGLILVMIGVFLMVKLVLKNKS